MLSMDRELSCRAEELLSMLLMLPPSGTFKIVRVVFLNGMLGYETAPNVFQLSMPRRCKDF